MTQSLESSGGAAETPNAFIFSLNHFEGLAPFVSKVKKGKTKEAVYRSSVYGPLFGQDLLIFINAASARQSFTEFGSYYSGSWQSWAGKEGPSHLMRWRYFILPHPAKCKITRTEFN